MRLSLGVESCNLGDCSPQFYRGYVYFLGHQEWILFVLWAAKLFCHFTDSDTQRGDEKIFPFSYDFQTSRVIWFRGHIIDDLHYFA
jgi:hypothetical protein